MKININPVGRIVAAAIVLGGLSVAPVYAADSTPAKTAAHNPVGHVDADTVETRIATLHEKLKITPAEATQWEAFAQVMRDNAQSMDSMLKDRESKTMMTAIEDLQSYQQLAAAHAAGMDKLVPAFQTLYNAMPDSQKKNADMVFHDYEGGPARKAS